MKHPITLAIVAFAALTAYAEYTALSFKTIGGENHSIEIPGLEIRFSQEALTATNSKTTISLPLAQLESMSFSDASDPGTVGSLTADRMTEATTVVDLNGHQLGTFASFSEAMARIPGGVYLFRYADGTTLKIVKE